MPTSRMHPRFHAPLLNRRHAAGALLLTLAGCATAPAPRRATNAPGATLPSIAIPGDTRFVAIARDVLRVQTAVMPDFASQSGLFDDGLEPPSFKPERVAALGARLRSAMAGLRALPWRSWDVDRQIDVRWVYANAARLERELDVERLYLHRPSAWLEPVASSFIHIVTYAPQRRDALDTLTARMPAMVAEMRTLCRPTAVDAKIAIGVLDGIVAGLKASPPAGADAALAALAGYRAELLALKDAEPFRVIGADNYAWRLRHATLLPWTPLALRQLAEQRLAEVDAEIARLTPTLPAEVPLSPELEQVAATLNQASLLRLYDRIQEEYRSFIEQKGFITIPAGVGPVKARVTPDAMVPLTGDGGSMNPPPPYIDDDTGWWNVEHFNPAMSADERRARVRRAALHRTASMGPYAVHEGVPGHHLQLAIARLNPNPLRNVFSDPVQNEGWALYAEQLMWEQGGFGPGAQSRVNMLRSWRGRIRRVVYDVNIETGLWSLQQGADWAQQAQAGQGRVGPEIQRAVNWPAQLVCYFAGKEQILQLKADCKKKMGHGYSERRFHDELLALGSVPYVFARAKMLGEAVPDFQ